MKPSLTRKRFLKILAVCVVGVGVGGALYASFLEPYWLVVERHCLKFGSNQSAPAGLRIVHLSDFHRSKIVPDSYLRECISKANELKPDLILMTGDYIMGKEKWANSLGDLLEPLRANLGVYATLGNHDGGKWAAAYGGILKTSVVKDELEKAGIRVLVNESVEVNYHGKRITLVGLGDLWAGQFDLPLGFQGVETSQFTIALSHNPDTIEELQNYPADLIFCGHTHGGQVRIPFWGPPILPIEDKQYAAGIYQVGEQVAYVNRGVGLLKRIRFNCRPEIACIDID